ncbi:MAG: LLM class F420-dependent oxidoreductase [Actinomycetota bacterium]|nr:LLM class F420-dependent oxidoreductase [Actinomycetota bacterium]
MERRLGMTIPFDTLGLGQQKSAIESLVESGYSDVWSSEVAQYDAFTPLILANEWQPTLNLGTAIVPAFTRGPATLAMSVAALSALAPGRFSIGIGSSSDVIVSKWNAVDFDKPFSRNRDILRFLREALDGKKVDRDFDTFSISGFRLASPPDSPPKILLAALRERMLKLAGSEGDGAILNWLSADDVSRVVPIVGDGKEIVARIFVAPNVERERFLEAGRRLIASYLNVGVYRDFHIWLGRSEKLEQMWTLWASGDRKGAVAAIPEEVVDELIVGGTTEECRRHIERYQTNGVNVAALAILPFGIDPLAEAVAIGKFQI